MIRLIVSYFEGHNDVRRQELEKVLKNNVELSAFDQIVILLEFPIEIPVKSDKIKVILIHERPTFDNIFAIANGLTGLEDVNVFANTDIYFDESLSLALKMGVNEAYALTRYDWFDNGHSFKEPKFLNRIDSQDAWIFKGVIKSGYYDFGMGVCGCDNALAYRLAASGYNVTNPSLSIKAFHLHSGIDRTYDVNKKVPQPYKTLNPIAL